jgi:hypothetical protein
LDRRCIDRDDGFAAGRPQERVWCRLAFQAIERRFAWQARVAIVIVGLTGLYMIVQADMWKLSAMNAHSSERSLPLTRRWSEGDSNSRSLPEEAELQRGTGVNQPGQL